MFPRPIKVALPTSEASGGYTRESWVKVRRINCFSFFPKFFFFLKFWILPWSTPLQSVRPQVAIKSANWPPGGSGSTDGQPPPPASQAHTSPSPARGFHGETHCFMVRQPGSNNREMPQVWPHPEDSVQSFSTTQRAFIVLNRPVLLLLSFEALLYFNLGQNYCYGNKNSSSTICLPSLLSGLRATILPGLLPDPQPMDIPSRGKEKKCSCNTPQRGKEYSSAGLLEESPWWASRRASNRNSHYY